jgi:hypothetical protein
MVIEAEEPVERSARRIGIVLHTIVCREGRTLFHSNGPNLPPTCGEP